MQGVQSNAQHRVMGLNNIAAQYAQGRFAKVFAEIDMAAATALANGLNSVNVQFSGQPKT